MFSSPFSLLMMSIPKSACPSRFSPPEQPNRGSLSSRPLVWHCVEPGACHRSRPPGLWSAVQDWHIRSQPHPEESKISPISTLLIRSSSQNLVLLLKTARIVRQKSSLYVGANFGPGLYLHKVAQLRGKDQNIWGEWHLTEDLELLIIHIYFLCRWVQWVETEKKNQSVSNNQVRPTQREPAQGSYLFWVSMCFRMRENRSDPVPLQHNADSHASLALIQIHIYIQMHPPTTLSNPPTITIFTIALGSGPYEQLLYCTFVVFLTSWSPRHPCETQCQWMSSQRWPHQSAGCRGQGPGWHAAEWEEKHHMSAASGSKAAHRGTNLSDLASLSLTWSLLRFGRVKGGCG